MRTPAAAPYSMTCSATAPQDFDQRHPIAVGPDPARNARGFGVSPPPQFYVGCKRPAEVAAAASDRRAATQTLIVAFFVLLCLFSCAMTVALLYQSHAETHRQIEEVISDLKAITNLVRDELVAKRAMVDDYKQHQQLRQKLQQWQQRAATYGDDSLANIDYEEVQLHDGDSDDGRFMGVDLDGNRKPSGSRPRTVAGGADAEAGGADAETGGAGAEAGVGTTVRTDGGRRRRSAAIDATKVAKNELNSSPNDKPNVELLQTESNEENKVPTNSLRKSKNLPEFIKKVQQPQEQAEEEEEMYKDSKNKQLAAAAHFASDSSKYNIRTHPHYQGNGRIKHPDGDYRDWSQHVWNGNSNANHFQLKNGIVEISTPGVYFVYAQIYYSDQHDVNGYFVMKNNEKVLGCTTTRHQGLQSDSCYTAGLIYFNAKDILSIKGIDMDRYIILDPIRTFFGFFEVAKHFR